MGVIICRRDVSAVRQEDGLPYWWRVAWVRPRSKGPAELVRVIAEGRSRLLFVAKLEAEEWFRAALAAGPDAAEVKPPFFHWGPEWRPITRRPKYSPHG